MFDHKHGRIDSSGRYWTFRSDSAFYYYPDSGLLTRQGLLSLWENKVQKQAWMAVMDSSHTEALNKVKLSIWKSYYRKVKDSEWTVVFGVLLVLGTVAMAYRYLR
ncbi:MULTISPECIES: hypothetical protein [Sphingobacterium]|uniref:hypothetical protein n=1 Tax=Sphingobacterium TaxID=28453 RepID=UPI0013DC97F4|nr:MULTISPECIES: hypothetical protein [unclassified Sphingobacterium]